MTEYTCKKCKMKCEHCKKDIDQRFMVQKGNNKYCCEYCSMFHYEPERKGYEESARNTEERKDTVTSFRGDR